MPTKPGDDDSNMDSEDSDSDEDSDDEELGGSGAPILQAIYFFLVCKIPYLPIHFSPLILIASMCISNVFVVMHSCARYLMKDV